MVNANRQCFWDERPAPGAKLTGITGINFDDVTTSFFRFVRQKVKEHPPCRIRDASGKASVLHHFANAQILDVDFLIVRNIVVRRFVGEVLSLPLYRFMRLRNELPGVATVPGASLLSCKAPLPAAYELRSLFQKPGIGNTVVIRIDAEAFDADVDSHGGVRYGEIPFRDVIAREGDEPFAGSSPADSHRLDVSHDGTGEEHLESPKSRDIEVSALKSPAGLLQGEGIIPASGTKARESRLVARLDSPEESLIRSVKALNHILQNLRAYRPIFREGSFQCGKLLHLPCGGDGNTATDVGINPLLKCRIVQSATQRQPAIARLLGCLRDLHSVLIRSSHENIIAKNKEM